MARINGTMNRKLINQITICAFVLFLVQSAAFAQDWANQKRYRAANEQLKYSKVKVVYIGDSITDFWINADPGFFSQNHYADRGISGQTSPQILLRFRQDVIDLKPEAVVILCGTNDIAGNTGPSTLEMTEGNIISMCELAKVNKIKVILCSVLPANHFVWSPKVEPADSIIALNNWIKGYAEAKHFAYVDYYPMLVDLQKGMKAEYSADGVHPNKDAYAIMKNLVQPVIDKVVK